MLLRTKFLSADFRLPIVGSATPLMEKGQCRLLVRRSFSEGGRSTNRKSKFGNRQCSANLVGSHGDNALKLFMVKDQ
jgi:hypothetical protein